MLKTKPYPNGLFPAAKCEETGYNKVWIRDNFYIVLSFLENGKSDVPLKSVHAWLDILLKHEYKIDWMIKQPEPKEKWRYIHPKYNSEGEELHIDWGDKQNDAIGALLWLIGRLSKKTAVLRDADDKRIVQKLVQYLDAIEYWHDPDNGIWEDNEEVHASSIGACLAGLREIEGLTFVPLHMIANGEMALKKMLPRESLRKEKDLALLSLVWPFNAVSEDMARTIVANVETLVRQKGVIRHECDWYYARHGEAEWTMGLPWLAICHKKLGNNEKHKYYLIKTKNAMNKEGELPELYYANSEEHNENTPLLWAESLRVVANAITNTK